MLCNFKRWKVLLIFHPVSCQHLMQAKYWNRITENLHSIFEHLVTLGKSERKVSKSGSDVPFLLFFLSDSKEMVKYQIKTFFPPLFRIFQNKEVSNTPQNLMLPLQVTYISQLEIVSSWLKLAQAGSSWLMLPHAGSSRLKPKRLEYIEKRE